MTIRQATEIIRQLGQSLGMDNLDFSDLSVSLIVDETLVTIEYLQEAAAFLIYGPTASKLDTGDIAAQQTVMRSAHYSAMTGGGALTIEGPGTPVTYSVCVPVDGLTAEDLGLQIGVVADGIKLYDEMLEPESEPAPTHEDSYTLRL